MTKTTENQKIKNAIAYIPFAAFILYFVDKEHIKAYGNHLKYSMVLCITRIVLLSILVWALKGLVTFAYFGLAGYLAFKAYNGEDKNIEIIDNIFKK